IVVQDNGAGIDPREHDKVFGLFARPPAAGPAGPPGTGVGLALCKRIVEDGGGRIWVEQALPRGSRFCFTVPAPGTAAGDMRAEAPPAAEDHPGAAPAPVLPGGTSPEEALLEDGPATGVPGAAVPQLLLVEDSEPHARLVTAALTEAPGPHY